MPSSEEKTSVTSQLKHGISKATKNIQKTWRKRRRSLRRASSVAECVQGIVNLMSSVTENDDVQHIVTEDIGSLLSRNEWNVLLSWLPRRYTMWKPILLYTSEDHGMLLRTLYSKVNSEPSLIVIKSHTGETFGAFCSSSWSDRQSGTKNLSYFGTGETFVFRLHPQPRKYEWVGYTEDVSYSKSSHLFMAGNNSVLLVGGGNGCALQLDDDFLHCRTERCDTFDNEPLCSEADFQCHVVEVYGLQLT